MRPPAQLQATIELLDLIADTGHPADRTMAQYFRGHRYIGSKDKAVISEQFYSLLRQRLSDTYLLETAGLPVNNRMRAALLLRAQGLSLLDYFNGEQYSPNRLEQTQRELLHQIDFSSLETAPLNVQLNVPEWIAPKLEATLGERYEPEMRASNQRANTDIRVNLLKSTVAQVTQSLASSGHDFSPTELSPWGIRFNGRVALFGLDSFKQGWFEIQDEGSQLLALLSGVKAGDRVVDFCAGAGGKTLAMAAMMNNKGTLYACDVHSKRLQQLAKRTKRAGVHNVRQHTLSSERDKWVKQHRRTADVVLVDAPCSGTGTWRRSPDSRWNLDPSGLLGLIELQQSILLSASRLVKQGGRLIYATCSLLQEENEQQVEQFLRHNPDFSYAKGVAKHPILANSDKVHYNGYSLRTFPAQSDTDGFYACVLTRAEE